MNPRTRTELIDGPVGAIEVAIDEPQSGDLRGIALACHPHPLHGGTMNNKVAVTLARAFTQLGFRALRFNCRGVGQTEGQWDEGRGEADDALAVLAHHGALAADVPLAIGGFSFGGFLAATVAERVGRPLAGPLVLVGPAAVNFSMPAVPNNTLVVHGELDDVVPLAGVLNWARPLHQPVTVIPGAGHFFHGQMTLLKTVVLRAWGAPGDPNSIHG